MAGLGLGGSDAECVDGVGGTAGSCRSPGKGELWKRAVDLKEKTKHENVMLGDGKEQRTPSILLLPLPLPLVLG